jgi:CheY-like chemotaxis protein
MVFRNSSAARPGLAGPPRRLPLPPPRRSILIVEDDVDLAELFLECLRWCGHDALLAADGPTALALAEAHRPAVALIDVGLPEMDGYEVGRRLRAMPCMESAFLVTVTGYATASHRLRSARAGFDAHVVKPFEFDALEDLILEQGGPRVCGADGYGAAALHASAESGTWRKRPSSPPLDS